MRALVSVLIFAVAGCSSSVKGNPSQDRPVADDDIAPPLACSAGEHACAGACAANDAVTSCGDRCSACPTVANGSATCDGTSCGVSCAAGYALCLGACVASACGTTLEANVFTKLGEGDTGTRRNASMVYLASTGEYVLNGGSILIGGSHPYDVQGLALADGVWRNHHPFDKAAVWGGDTGNTSAPEPVNEGFNSVDSQGVVRPSWGVYPNIPTYFQYAYDPATERQVFYLKNRTFVYDVAARTYDFPTVTIDPVGGPPKAPLVWGAMAYDSAADQVVLFGGGNVRSARADPGTWMYDVGSHVWRAIPGPMPPQRALSRMVVDPGRRRAVLFGGDQLDVLLADTWVFDFATEAWEELTPAQVPEPRAGHHLLYLPSSGRIVLLGGYGYASDPGYYAPHYATLPWEVWRFDWATPSWELVKHFGDAEETPSVGPTTFTTAAAAGAGDVVVVQIGATDGGETWALRIDASATQDATAYAWPPTATTTRTGPYDPAWFTSGVPAPDPAAFAADLNARADNGWSEITIPNRPRGNRDWGTATIDPVRKVVYRWSGGHAAHSGTDVLEWNYADNRYAIAYAPEFPLEFDYTNDQIPGGQWSFKNRPFMAVHTYRAYVYAPAIDRVVIHKNGVTYFYDPTSHDFDADHPSQALGGSQFDNVLAATATDVFAWTPNGVFRLDGDQSWEPLTLSSAALPAIGSDRTTMLYDSMRDRLLLASTAQGAAGELYALNTSTGVVTSLSPAGKAALVDLGFQREGVYLPAADLVFFGGSVVGARTLVYDCAENRWYGYAVDPSTLQAAFYDVSLGVTTDGNRIFAMNTDSRMFTLTIDKATVDKVGF